MSTIPTQYSNSPRFRGRVLVIDDESHVLSIATMMLTSQGFDVVPSESGDQGVELLLNSMHTEQQINAVVLDLTMPGGLSGFDVLEQLLEISPYLPVIACSGYFQEDARELCQSIGFADVLQKPYTLEHLCDTVRLHLARDRQLA
jgi:CheY-like chemotaxis protein